MLARMLHLAGMAASVFERDAGPLARARVGTLELHEGAGLLALRRAGLHAQVRRIAPEVQADARAGSRAGVDRTALCGMLLEALPARCVYWDCELRQVLPWGHGCWKLALDGGEVGPFDLVVGATGAGAKIRPPLSPAQPRYRGLTLLGDGARQTPPSGDARVNAAMLDAVVLGRLLADTSHWAEAVAIYEAGIFERARQAAPLAHPSTMTQEQTT